MSLALSQRLIVVTCLTVSNISLGRDYGVDLRVEGGSDIEDLQRAGLLTEEQAFQLIELFYDPVDLRTASAIELYELPGVSEDLALALSENESRNTMRNVREIATVKGMTPEILEQIAPFVRTESKTEWQNMVANRFIVTKHDEHVQTQDEVSVSSQTQSWRLGAGLLSTPRTRVVWDASRGILVAKGAVRRPELSHVSAEYRWFNARIVVGNYSIHAAQQLVLGRGTNRRSSSQRNIALANEDFLAGRLRSSNDFLGIFAEAELPWSWGVFSSLGFVSYQPRDVYQYDIKYSPDRWDTTACFSDGDCPSTYQCEAQVCKSSFVGDATNPEHSLRYQTISHGYREFVSGAQVAQRSTHFDFGTTFYGAAVTPSIDGANVDFSESSNIPAVNRSTGDLKRSEFGVLGLFGRFNLSPFDFQGEIAATANGGKGAFAKLEFAQTNVGVWSTSVRIYDGNFHNPFGRPPSDIDQWEGSTAANERGLRLNYNANGDTFAAALSSDIWQSPWDNGSTAPMMSADRRSLFLKKSLMLRGTWNPRPWAITLGGAWRDGDSDSDAMDRRYSLFPRCVKNCPVSGNIKLWANTSFHYVVKADIRYVPFWNLRQPSGRWGPETHRLQVRVSQPLLHDTILRGLLDFSWSTLPRSSKSSLTVSMMLENKLFEFAEIVIRFGLVRETTELRYLAKVGTRLFF